MILLLGRGTSRTLTIIERAARARGLSTVRLDSRALVHDLTVCDAVNGQGKVEIEWQVGDVTFTDQHVAGVINLLDDLEFAEFNHVRAEDRLFAWREWRAYLSFALSSFPNVINPPLGQHLSGTTRSLCFQWLAMQELDSSIAVPRWVYGLRRDFPLFYQRPCRTVVSTDPFDLRRWERDPDQWVDPDKPYLFYEAPFGESIQASVFDDRCGVWPSPSGLYVPEAVEERIRILSVRLTRRFGLRWARTQFFYNTHPQRLTFASIEPSPELDWAPAYVQGDLVDAMMRTFGDRSDDDTVRRHRISPGPRLDRTLIPTAARLTPQGAVVMPAPARRPPDVRGILLVASIEDPTAHYFSRMAMARHVPVTWWPAEQLIGLSAHFTETLVRPDPSFSVYYRRPGTSEPELHRVLCLLDDMLEAFDGRVVGNTYDAGSNHSKPLHAARCAETRASAVRWVPLLIRSGQLPLDPALVVKALSVEKAEVLLLSELSVSPETYPAPTLLQPLVRATNIRVHVCGGIAEAVEIQSDRLDYRFDSRFTVAPRKLPRDVEEWCVTAAAREGIVFAGIDLLFDGETHYCLEINPNPGYHVFEERLVEGGYAPVISEGLFRHLQVPVTA